MAHGDPIVGTDGAVTWTTIGNAVSHVESWAYTQEAAEVEITDFQDTGWAAYTTAIRRISGTITCNARAGYVPDFASSTVAVLTLNTASATPYWTTTGSAILTKVDAGRAYGDTPDKITYSFRGTGEWSDPAVGS